MTGRNQIIIIVIVAVSIINITLFLWNTSMCSVRAMNYGSKTMQLCRITTLDDLINFPLFDKAESQRKKSSKGSSVFKESNETTASKISNETEGNVLDFEGAQSLTNADVTEETSYDIVEQKDDPRVEALLQKIKALSLGIQRLSVKITGKGLAGGYCPECEVDTATSRNYQPSRVFVEALVNFWVKETKGDEMSLAEFGAGEGEYGFIINELKPNWNWKGYAVNVGAYLRSRGMVNEQDFTEPFDAKLQFDWVYSFDQAGNIPASKENKFLANLHRHNKYGIILTWPPHGDNMINVRDATYVIEKFTQWGYGFDQDITNQLREQGYPDMFKYSLYVFRKLDLSNVTPPGSLSNEQLDPLPSIVNADQIITQLDKTITYLAVKCPQLGI